MKSQKISQIVKAKVRKKSKVVGITLSDFKLHYNIIIIKTSEYQHKNRHLDQRNGIETPGTNPHSHGQLIYDKRVKNMQCGNDGLLKKMVVGGPGEIHTKQMKQDHLLYHIQK